MAIAFRNASAWAEHNNSNPTLTLPSGTTAGDRLFMVSIFKPYTVSPTPTAGWSLLVNFADGTTASGNGTGSVKVGVQYIDYTGGESLLAQANSGVVVGASCLLAFSKAGGESWDTPTFVTAAMTTWTTSSQTTSASSSTSVPSGAVVISAAGIRDDSATFTRPTTGIDDSTGAITWNGNYAEAPATHQSSTTGDDYAADTGYRLVTTGATATLRQTATLSASETGTLAWVIQGLATPGTQIPTRSRQTPQILAH